MLKTEIIKNESINAELVQVILDDNPNELWFVGNSVAKCLGYSNPRDAIGKFIDDRDKKIINMNTVAIRDGNSKGNPNTTIINESGLYSLIMSSKLPTAKEFQHWVTSEVLPTLRKDGMYIMGEERCETEDEIVLKAFTLLQNKVTRLSAENKILATDVENYKPKAMAYMDLCNNGEFTVQTLADMLCNSGVPIGRNELFEWLRLNDYVCKKSTNPTRKSLRQKLMGATSAIVNGKTVTTPYVTGKGLEKFYNKYIEEHHITKAPPLF